MRFATLLAALAVAAPAFAHPQANPRGQPNPPCKDLPPSKEFLDAAKSMAEADANGITTRNAKSLVIDTYIHVLAQDNTEAGGYIPANKLAAQMVVLNNNFAPSSIQFRLLGTDYTVNSVWANWDVNSGTVERAFKSKLRKGDYKTLNLYFHHSFTGITGLLGICNFPDDVKVHPEIFDIDGCDIHASIVPGALTPYPDHTLGNTVSHEVGHWFGLLHTFQGGSCSATNEGDLIADTPQEETPGFGCIVGRDTCPGSPGLDPINNFMDYSDDVCRTQFTPGQAKRAFDMFKRFREGQKICNADNCLRAMRSNSVPGRLQESQAFCKDFLKNIITEVTVLPKYAADKCTREPISQVSSACVCLAT